MADRLENLADRLDQLGSRPDPALAEDVRDFLRESREAGDGSLRRAERLERLAVRLVSPRPTPAWFVGGLILISIGASGGCLRFGGAWWLLGIALTLGVIAVVLRRRALKRARLAAEECRNCGYLLWGLPVAIEPARLDGIDVGPRRCPECAARWPRLPGR